MLIGYNCKRVTRPETEFVIVLLIWLGYVWFIKLRLCHYIERLELLTEARSYLQCTFA